MVFWSISLSVIFTYKNAPADVGSLFHCRLPFAPFNYGKTCACLFCDISHTKHLRSANGVVGCTHKLCGQIKAALWLLSERKVHKRVGAFFAPQGKCSVPCWLSQDRQCSPQESPKGAHTTSGGISVRTP